MKIYTRRQLMMEEARVKPYISDGLVFHLDGADATDTTWVDRIGGKVFTLHNARINGEGVIFHTTAYFAAGASYASASTMHNVTPTAGTIEICAYRTGIRASNEPEHIVFGGTTNRIVYVVASNGTYVVISNNNTNNAPRALINGRTLEKFTHSINAARHVYNGQLGELGANIANVRSGYVQIGCRTDGHYAFEGIVYQVRIYNRQLTEEEMKWNQEQDRKRYGITFNI